MVNGLRHACVAAAAALALAACGGEQAETQKPMMGEQMGQQPMAEQMGEQMGEQPMAGQMGEQMGEQMMGQQQAEGKVPAKLPEGVTAEMIKQGKEIFGGAGICFTCHGQDAKGVQGLGASLVDKEWKQSDGSYQGIVNTIMKGVSAEKSTTKTPMPPKGGSQITDAQVKAVAAYVWSLSQTS